MVKFQANALARKRQMSCKSRMSERVTYGLDFSVARVSQNVVNPSPRFCLEVGPQMSCSLLFSFEIEAAESQLPFVSMTAECTA